MQTDEIKEIQQYLRAISFTEPRLYPVVIDGKYGAHTANAVATFQEIADLPSNGIVDPVTWDRLVSVYREITEPPTKLNVLNRNAARIDIASSKDTVAILQSVLWFLSNHFNNLPSVDINGIFDTKTQSCVMQFQELHQLPSNGVVNTETWNILAAIYNNDHNTRHIR